MEQRTRSPYPRIDRPVLAAVGILLAALVFTVVGMFLRGPYWNLYWPWQPWPEIPGRI